jgi:RNA polymerase sigma-70 factor (ECF subfamily)
MAGSEPAKRVWPDRPGDADERRLIAAAQKDSSRFAEVYETYFEIVYAYVARRTRDRAAAEDLSSEVFRKALASLPRFKWTGAPFGAWLLRIASNLIADRAKREVREGKVPLDEGRVDLQISNGVEGSSLTVAPGSGTQANSAQAQQSELEDAERRARLFGLIDLLAADQRQVIVMRFADEKSIKQIASEMNRSEGAVKQLQFRALESLRKMISTQRTWRTN